MHRRVRSSTHLSLSALLVLGLAGHASAQDEGGEPPRVYIVSVPMNDSIDAVATRGGAAARAALRGIEGVDWRGPDQRFLGYDGSALSVLQRARQQLDEGRNAYLQLELESAVEQLQGAVDNFDAAAAALEDPQDLGEALLLLGASHAFNGQRRDAMRVFARLHTQMPHIQPDPNTFPPEVVQLYERSRPRDARRPSGTISVDSSPQGAIVYVDFLARGRTPINVDGLIAGDHVLRVTRPGATPFVETLDVPRRRAATSNAFLVDTPELEGMADAINEIPTAAIENIEGDNPIAQVASMLQLDKIGVIRVSRQGQETVALELLLYDVASGRRLVRGEQRDVTTNIGDFESAVQQAVSGAFEAALRPTQASDTEQIPAVADPETPFVDDGEPNDTQPERPVTEQWWFWTIIGAVAIGAVVGIGVGVGLATDGPSLGADPGGQVVFTF